MPKDDAPKPADEEREPPSRRDDPSSPPNQRPGKLPYELPDDPVRRGDLPRKLGAPSDRR